MAVRLHDSSVSLSKPNRLVLIGSQSSRVLQAPVLAVADVSCQTEQSDLQSSAKWAADRTKLQQEVKDSRYCPDRASPTALGPMKSVDISSMLLIVSLIQVDDASLFPLQKSLYCQCHFSKGS